VLGLRGVRLCFKRPEMFKTQLTALLAAADAGDLRILVPMVSSVEEIRRVRALLDEAREELLDRGVSVPDNVPLGAMIEVPSAAITADLIAPRSTSSLWGPTTSSSTRSRWTGPTRRSRSSSSRSIRRSSGSSLTWSRRRGSPASPSRSAARWRRTRRSSSSCSGSASASSPWPPDGPGHEGDRARRLDVEAARIAKAALSLATAEEVASLLGNEGPSFVRAGGGAEVVV